MDIEVFEPREVRAGRERKVNRRIAVAQEAAQSPPLMTESEIVARAEVAEAPRVGIYFLISAGRIVYVGKSINIMSRVSSHYWRREFDSWAWIACGLNELDAIERSYIDRFMPTWNKDSRTSRLRGPSPSKEPAVPDDYYSPFQHLSPTELAEWSRERKEYLDAIWTEDRVMAERMRRLREIKTGRATVSSFGPMPLIGDAYEQT